MRGGQRLHFMQEVEVEGACICDCVCMRVCECECVYVCKHMCL